MTGWHIEEAAAAAYGGRRLSPVERASLEAHATRCAECRSRLVACSAASSTSSGDGLWDRIESRVTAPKLGPVSRALVRSGIRMPDVVVLRAVASQSRPWTIAATLVLVAAALTAMLGPVDSGLFVFLGVAPLVPAVGVAVTFRLVPSGVDLLERVAPYSPARMLLWRTAYVVVVAVPPALVAGVVVLADPWAAVGWLLPAAACTLCVAAASTWTDPTRPAVVVALVWAVVVTMWAVRDATWAITSPATQMTALAVIAVAATVLQQRLSLGLTGPGALRTGRE